MILGTVHNILAFALQLRKTPEHFSYEIIHHRLKWGPFSPNEVGRIAQHVSKGEGRKEGKQKPLVQSCPDYNTM